MAPGQHLVRSTREHKTCGSNHTRGFVHGNLTPNSCLAGEIDIVETKNEMGEITTGIQHGGVNPFNQKIVKETRQPNNVPWSDTFHTYKVTWGLDTMTFSIDGVDVQTVKSRSIDPVNGWWV